MNDDASSRRLAEICQQLGYLNSETFVTTETLGAGAPILHAVREAFTTIGVAGVFSLKAALEPSPARPIVYLATATDADHVRQIRKDVWTQGVVPFLIILSQGTLTFCSGFLPPSEKALIFDDYGDLPDVIANLAAGRLNASVSWQNFDVALKFSVDNRLVRAIEALNKAARKRNPALDNKRNLVNAAIGRFLYLYVLIDRGILHEDWLRGVSDHDGAGLFAHSVCKDAKQAAWGADDAFQALDAVDREINGSVFPISTEDRSLLTDDVCQLIHAVLRAGTKVQGVGREQLDFFDVSYRILRTETISAIYERFVAIEDGKEKADDGVFYTPPHLADHLLDLIDEVRPLTDLSRVIDPAAGSGVFLVGAYRRIMERSTPSDGWSPRHIHLAHKVLETCIYGLEKQPQAANVCRFSLYLTLLDYVGRAPIEVLAAAAGEVKFLPKLDANILSVNAFSLAHGNRGYTHVVGNPPWSQAGGQKNRSNAPRDRRDDEVVSAFAESLNKTNEPIAHGRLSDLFVWLARKHLAAADGIIAFVLPTRSLVGLHSNRFAHGLARAMTPVFIGNLSHLRRKLFDGAEAPAMIVVLRNRSPDRTDQVAVYRPLLTSLPLGQTRDVWALFLAQADMQYFRADDMQSGSSGWYEQTMLRALDRRTRGALVTWTRTRARSFENFLDRSELTVTRGGSPKASGVSRTPDGADKDVSVIPLTSDALGKAKPEYRSRFSGNVILVPRSMAEAYYLREPHAYSSTFNAILPKAQLNDQTFDQQAAGRYQMNDMVIRALVKYLNAQILQYFAGLFGSGQLTDNARFEREELLSIPCPFESIDDPSFLDLAKAEDVDIAILDAMGAGQEFRKAYKDFRDFRANFGNSKIPKNSFLDPDTSDVDAYLTRFKAEISSALPHGTSMALDVPRTSDKRVPDTIYVLLHDGVPTPLTAPTSRFLGTSMVEAMANGSQVSIWKSVCRHAWTIEQAVADAQVVIRELARDPSEHRKPAA